MKNLLRICLLTLLLAGWRPSSPVWAQRAATAVPSPTLEQLHQLALLPPGLPLRRLTRALLPEGWDYQGPVGERRKFTGPPVRFQFQPPRNARQNAG